MEDVREPESEGETANSVVVIRPSDSFLARREGCFAGERNPGQYQVPASRGMRRTRQKERNGR